MKPTPKTLIPLLALLAVTATHLYAQGTAFTYQGRLNSGGAAAAGIYDLRFAIYDSTNLPGNLVAGPATNSATGVSNGLFLVTLDFGTGVFTGANRWLEIAVRTNGSGSFTPLTPRQPMTPTPYAIFANTASNLVGTLPAAQITGPIAPANIAPGTITGGMLAPGAVSTLGSPDGSPTNAVQVDNNGLVGIGTSTPVAGLQITSGAPITTLPVLFEVQNGQQGWTNMNYALSAAANGNLLAVGGDTGLTLVNITNPAAPAMLSQIPGGSGAYADLQKIYGLTWVGSNLVAGTFGFGANPGAVFIIGCTNPASPVKIAELKNGVNGWNYLDEVLDIAASGNLLAIFGDFSNAVTLADISNPAAPVLRSVLLNTLNGYTNLQHITSVALSGSLLAIGSANGVTLVDVSNPSTPVKLVDLLNGMGGYTNLSGASSVALSGNLLAVASSGSSAVTLVNVSNPINPVKLAELRDGVGGYAFGWPGKVTLAGNWLAIASSANYTPVTLVDVSNPTSPVLLATASQGMNGADYLDELYDITFAGTNLVTCGFGSSIVWPNTPEGAVTIFGIATQSAGLSSAGWVGIGTTHPNAPLDVVGNVLVENAAFFNVGASHVSFGLAADAAGYYSTALGFYANANGNFSTVIGQESTANGNYATAMGYQALAAHNNTFVWSDGSIFYPAFSSTTSNEFSICAQNGVHIQSDKGIHLHATNAPIIVRDFDVFAANAPSSKAGIGRWGMFQEANALVMGIPGDDTTGRTFQVAKYNTNGTPTTLLQVDQSGNTRMTGLLRNGTETGTSNPPGLAGLVVRRVNSLANSISNVIARTDVLTLERDGSNEGLLIRYPAGVGPQTINCVAQSLSGTNIIVHATLNNPALAGTVQLLTSAQRAVHAQVSFGNTRFAGHVTQVVIDRYDDGTTDDNYWVGTLTSTYNQ